jgi:F-type H+-transporting ATPase subunit b
MTRRIISTALFAAALYPHVAFAAEEAAEDHGSWLLFAFFAINFVIFVYLLARFAGPAIRKYLTDRSSTIRSTLTRAESALSAAEALAGKAAQQMAALEAELKQTAAEIEQETAFQVARVAELARSTAERVRRDAVITGTALGEAARRRVRARLAESAAALARDLIGSNFQASDQGRLIDGFMDRIGGDGANR